MRNCSVRKGLYETWLSLGKHTATRPVKGDSMAPRTQTAPDKQTSEGIGNEYQAFFQCLSDAALPADNEGGHSMCKDASSDRLAAVVCEAALYIKTGRTNPKELLDALRASKKSAEMIWDLQMIAESGSLTRPAAIFLPDGPAYKIVDELFVLVLDDKEMAAVKYFQIAGAAVGTAGRHVDAQLKILLRESPAVVVKEWGVLRQHQPRLKQVLAELAREVPAAEMNKLRRGIVGFCTPGNLDCPEILRVVGHPE